MTKNEIKLQKIIDDLLPNSFETEISILDQEVHIFFENNLIECIDLKKNIEEQVTIFVRELKANKFALVRFENNSFVLNHL